MKLLVIHSELGVLRGGGENFTRNLFGVLATRGHQVSAAFVAAASGRYPVVLPTGIKPIPICGWWTRKPGQSALSFLARYASPGSRPGLALQRVKDSLDWRGASWHDRRFQNRIRREFAGRWQDYDAIYVHSNVELAAEAARYCPTVLRLPGPVPADKEPLLRAVSAVCANGDVLSRLSTFMGDAVVDLPAGLDLKAFSPAGSSVRADLGWTGKQIVMGYVGRLTRLKGADLLAEAFRQVAANFPEARLIIIGLGEEEDRVRHVLAKEIEGGKVRIVPGLNASELPPWYRAMDVFVLPSRYENFSNALLEAAACGIPFIASDVGGNRILQKSGAGELFEPGSVEDLRRCMSAVLVNPGPGRAQALAFASVVRERYNWNVSADRLELILQSLLKLRADQAQEQPRQSRELVR